MHCGESCIFLLSGKIGFATNLLIDRERPRIFRGNQSAFSWVQHTAGDAALDLDTFQTFAYIHAESDSMEMKRS